METFTGLLLQRRRGCITNSSKVFAIDKWGVNGEDFLSFDPQTLKWTALSDKANSLAKDWNTQTVMNGAYRHFSQMLCNNSKIFKQVARTNNDAQTGKCQPSESCFKVTVCLCLLSLLFDLRKNKTILSCL